MLNKIMIDIEENGNMIVHHQHFLHDLLIDTLSTWPGNIKSPSMCCYVLFSPVVFSARFFKTEASY